MRQWWKYSTVRENWFPIGLMVLILATLIGVTALVFAGSENGSNDRNDQIRECVASGGHASFSSDQYGDVQHYYGCERP